jgi:hypothetical protein
MLNEHLQAFRVGRRGEAPAPKPIGTIDWLAETYYRSRAFTKLSKRTQPDYREGLALVADIKLSDGRRLGDIHVRQISAAVVDKVYTKHLLLNPEGRRRPRQAALCVALMRRVWSVVRRLHPTVVPIENPWVGVILEHDTGEIQPATRQEAFALAEALNASGHPHLAIVPIICFEWLQRPENVLAGHLTWGDIRPEQHPAHVRIDHPKTGAKVLQPLEDADGRLFPEVEERLTALPRLGVAVVLTAGERGEHRPYSYSYARRMVREARRAAGLPEYVTLTACRHGGMTELGDAELTEQSVMALSGHKTPQAARLYIKRTDQQRRLAARRRRAWIEGLEERTSDDSENAAPADLRMNTGERS